MGMTSSDSAFVRWVLIGQAVTMAFAVAASAEGAPKEPTWDFSDTVDGILIRTRAVEGTRVREVFAETTVDGTVGEYVAVITDVENFPKFMPYVKEGRILRKDPSGTQFTYFRLELPWPLSPRDYTTRRVIESEPDPSGEGEFKSRWSAAANEVPIQTGTVRVTRDDGFWRLAAKEAGKVLIQHGFIVDPGGEIPAFLVNYASRKGVPNMLKAIENEVRRRRLANAAGPATR
jgi:hypothetical protein